MTISFKLLKASSLPIVAGMMMASPLFAQEAPTVSAPPIVPTPEVVTPTTVAPPPAVTPPPAVPTIAPADDRIAPQAQAEVEAERTNRAIQRSAARGASSPPRSTGRNAQPATVSEAIAPDAAPVVNVPSQPANEVATDSSQLTLPAVNDAEPAEPLATDANEGASDWMLGAGILGALGLAGIALALRRRRSGDVVSSVATQSAPMTPVVPGTIAPSPVGPATFVPPDPDPFFAQQRQVRHQTSDPLFAARKDDARPSGDPLFAYRPEQTPVTDPLFSRKIDVPPITDPMFAHHPEYEGRGADRKVDRTTDVERAAGLRQPQAVN
ncbi:MAG: hypothetical protein IBJ12_04295 [Sphingomonadaceae bacterium]|nr:hypothetical protein [Sphingomonadaceae bacterium]